MAVRDRLVRGKAEGTPVAPRRSSGWDDAAVDARRDRGADPPIRQPRDYDEGRLPGLWPPRSRLCQARVRCSADE
jgi:hypothetical protein